MYGELKVGKDLVIKVSKPTRCPHCENGIDAKILDFYIDGTEDRGIIAYVLMKCPICGDAFVCEYQLGTDLIYAQRYIIPHGRVMGGSAQKESFSKEINDISPSFVEIYNQAFQAEQEGLKDICGMGYRKAFEYLLKDYAISLLPEKEDNIAKSPLSKCLALVFNDDERKIFDRATWLGNDHTHFYNYHESFSVQDLKEIIGICVSKVESKIKEAKYIEGIKDIKEDK